jgi:hypothetical protein
VILNEAAAIIRLCYPPAVGAGEPNAEWRIDHFARRVLPRLLAQPELDIWVWVHPRHAERVGALDASARTFTTDPMGVGTKPLPWAAVRGMPRYRDQVLLGSDDYLGPEFMRTARTALGSSPRGLVTFQPGLLDLPTGKVYLMPPYRVDRPSPICVLRQDPRAANYTWVWALSHTRLHEVARPATLIRDRMHALLVTHAYNDSTTTARYGVRVVPGPYWL